MSDINTLAFSLRTESKAVGFPIKLGQAQQLVAAALGYASFASYQASTEAAIPVAEIRHFLPNTTMLVDRAKSLKLPHTKSDILDLLRSAVHHALPSVSLHDSEASLDEYIRLAMDDKVVNSNTVSAEMAMTNPDGVDEVYFESDEFFSKLPEPGNVYAETVYGHVAMGIDLDRPYTGHKINFEVELRIWRTGKHTVAEPEIEVMHANLVWPGDDEDEVMEA